ncbi:hypothetical protein GCM10010324_50220 [Streptomyces hiroshimensis]|uniref:Uncharacterized protein n=1 Tax=Streptomyces hiroshimensis TaxID=66424 RepID=A0ABQ2Z0D7_9ACTN|nr:hypothetical protein GCM10010324_50220 [Streptomyces hiroshimensis]
MPRLRIPRPRRRRRGLFPAPHRRTGVPRFARAHRIQIAAALVSGTLPAAAQFLGPWLWR